MENLKEDLGSYISIYLGNAKDESIRYRAASGGVVTSLLIYMFDERLIDAACVVAAKKDEPSISKATILNNREDALAVSGSRYDPAPLRHEVEKLLNMNRRIAIVGLPYEVQTLRKAFQSEWENNIKLCIGLFCGFTLSPSAVDFVLRKLKLKPEDLRLFEYRAGKWPGGLRIETKDGRVFNFSKSIYNILNALFMQRSCLSRSDLFNEYADISVGDAWYNLPDDKGYSTVIIRSSRGKQIFDAAVRKGYIEGRQINPDIIYRSHGHLMRLKRHRGRLFNTVIHMIRFGWIGDFLKILPLPLLLIISRLYRKKIKYE